MTFCTSQATNALIGHCSEQYLSLANFASASSSEARDLSDITFWFALDPRETAQASRGPSEQVLTNLALAAYNQLSWHFFVFITKIA